MSKKDKKKMLPAILMASAMVVPNAAMASEFAKDLSFTEGAESPAAPMVTDSQAAWSDDSMENIYQAQWAEVTWGQVVWARAGDPLNRTP